VGDINDRDYIKSDCYLCKITRYKMLMVDKCLGFTSCTLVWAKVNVFRMIFKTLCYFHLRLNHNFSLIAVRSEEHTSELQSRFDLVCRLLLEKKNNIQKFNTLKM